MPDLVVIVPSRGRPQAIAELMEAFKETCTASTGIALALDSDDQFIDEYKAATRRTLIGGCLETLSTRGCPAPSTMVKALNYAAHEVSGMALREHDPVLSEILPPPFAVGFMGDDHRPRTKGWDAAYLEALRDLGTGIVYGDDLLQRGGLPTQCAMTADIIRELGYMAPPTLTHLAVDNWWLDLGRQAGCIRYLPDVVVEHMHPVAGKAEWDEGHRRVNAPEMYSRDLAEFARIQGQELAADVAKVRALRGSHV